ncbi:hypothetical protein J4E91_009515 [Alternaria rosae]|nr:hypothetical protein J4E91_009515 [Alternaria rosae]
MSTSTFLSLPGEIRNRIYEYCIESKAIQIPRMPKRSKNPYEYVCCGLYGSLRNVCRQTRAEFGPMYMAKTVLVIHQVTANKFLYSFYPELRKQELVASEQLQRDRPTDKLPVSTGVPGVQGNIQIITYFGLRYDATPLIWFTFHSSNVMEKFMARVGKVDPRQALIEMGAPPMDTFAVVFTDCTGTVDKRSDPQA